MTYSEKNFFRFPFKVYDTYSMINASIKEDKEIVETGEASSIPVDYVPGGKWCFPEKIISVVENYHKGQELSEVISDGFPCSVVMVDEGTEVGMYECIWTAKRFLKELDTFMEKKLK